MRHSRGVADTLTAATSIWPTPMAGTPAQNGNSAAGNSDFSRKAEAIAADLWTTPSATDGRRGGAGITESMTGSSLTQKVNQWPTATSTDANGARSFGLDGRRIRPNAGPTLNDLTHNWPTPASRDHKGENSPDHLTNGSGRLHLDQLPNAVAFLYSRPDPQTETHGPLSWPQARIGRHLLRAAMSLPPRSISRPFSAPTRRKPSNPAFATYREAQAWRRWSEKRTHWWTKRRLSPAFVTWLMGWPDGHALCACSATEFTLWLQRMRGALSQLPMASGQWIWKPPASAATPAQMTMEW
ncbi:MAG TPA: hypothetical protein PKY73_18925 [Hyphomonas sp.]|nr:hypothetical protein [Hyphomonas sp.]